MEPEGETEEIEETEESYIVPPHYTLVVHDTYQDQQTSE